MSARFAVDVRSLALFRILLGGLLVADLLQRSADLSAHYTDWGVLPRAAHRATFDPVEMWSLHLLAGGAPAQALLFLLAGAAALALAVGLWTPLATFTSWLLLVSLQHRQPLVLTGGDSLLLLVLFWSLFLPLGACWSLDARRRPPPAGGALVRSAAATALVVQLLLVYLLAALFKLEDPSWQRLTALEESFAVEGVATDLARSLLGHPVLLRAAAVATLLLELLGPWLVFSRWRAGEVRTAVVFAFVGFHLLGTGSTMALGLIPYVMATAWTPLLPPWFWERALPRALERLGAPPRWIAALRRPASAPGAASDAAPRPAARLRDLAVWVLLAAVVVDAVGSLDRAAYRRRAPAALRSAVLALGLFQNWQLWSTPLDNRYYVLAARLRDGTQVDLHTGEALDWSRPRRRSENPHWWKYQLHLSRPYAVALRRFWAAWLAREWDRRHAPEERVEALEIVQLSGPWDAPPGELRRTRLWPVATEP